MKRDTFLPSITTLVIFGMTLFLSCAHQNRVRDGLNEEAGEEEAFVSEEGSTAPEGEAPQGDLAELSEPPPAEGATEAVPVEEGAPVEGATAEAVPGTEDADLQALGIESSTPPTDSAALEATTTTEVGDATAGALSTDPAAGGAVAGAEGGTDPLAGLEAGAAGATAGALADSSSSDPLAPPPTEPPPTNNVEITRMEPIIDTGAGSRGAVDTGGSSGWAGSSSVPKIPSKSVTRRGTELNRFYMARSGDTPESVSNLFYGSPDRAGEVANWNGNSFAPGKVLYYKSAIEPDDHSMRSFYQEKGVQPEEYTVAKGDWLSTVAKIRLGHPKSWKEIAVVNGMSSPDSLEVGQKLAIYPKDLSGYSKQVVEEPKPEPQQVAQVPEPVQPQQQFQPPQNQPADPNQEMAQANPPPVQEAPPQEPVKVQKPQAVDPSKVLEQNLPAVFILGGVLILSILYLVVRRKKTAKPLDDFGDDNFAPPTKLKRK